MDDVSNDEWGTKIATTGAVVKYVDAKIAELSEPDTPQIHYTIATECPSDICTIAPYDDLFMKFTVNAQFTVVAVRDGDTDSDAQNVFTISAGIGFETGPKYNNYTVIRTRNNEFLINAVDGVVLTLLVRNPQINRYTVSVSRE